MARRPLNAGHFVRPLISTSTPGGSWSSAAASDRSSCSTAAAGSASGPSAAGDSVGDIRACSATLSLRASAHSCCRNIPCGMDCTCRSSSLELSKWMKVLRTVALPSGVARPGGLPMLSCRCMALRGLEPGEPGVEAAVEQASSVAVSQCCSAPARAGVPFGSAAALAVPAAAPFGEVDAVAAAALAQAASLNRCSCRSWPRPKLSHLSPGCCSTSLLACFRCPALMRGISSVARPSSAKNAAMRASISISSSFSAPPRGPSSKGAAMRCL
mmetsp:Transcript_37610/g.107690  ORF Transcript_37610/g.107690 Transcript_37610/m.107690 type:complete len:271 (-) Transcript_37610:63-875(-)